LCESTIKYGFAKVFTLGPKMRWCCVHGEVRVQSAASTVQFFVLWQWLPFSDPVLTNQLSLSGDLRSSFFAGVLDWSALPQLPLGLLPRNNGHGETKAHGSRIRVHWNPGGKSGIRLCNLAVTRAKADAAHCFASKIGHVWRRTKRHARFWFKTYATPCGAPAYCERTETCSLINYYERSQYATSRVSN